MLAGLVGDGHLTAVGVDDYVIDRINGTHSCMCFLWAKVVKMIDMGKDEGVEVPLRGTFSLDCAWTKLRGPSVLLHGLTDK